MKVGDLVRIRQVYCDAVGIIVETSLNGALRVLFQNATTEYLWQYQVELVSESR